MLVTAFMIVFAFTTLVVGSFLLEMSRSFDMKFFDPDVRRQLAAVAAPVLDLRPPRGLHPVPAGGRRGVDDHPGVRPAQDRRLRVARRRLRRHRLHVVRAVGPPHVRRRAVADRASFFSAASIAIGIPAGMQIFAWLATIVGRPAGLEDAAAVRRRIHRHVRHRRHHRGDGRLGPVRPAGPRLVLRRRPPALRADRRRRLPDLRRRLLLAARSSAGDCSTSGSARSTSG